MATGHRRHGTCLRSWSSLRPSGTDTGTESGYLCVPPSATPRAVRGGGRGGDPRKGSVVTMKPDKCGLSRAAPQCGTLAPALQGDFFFALHASGAKSCMPLKRCRRSPALCKKHTQPLYLAVSSGGGSVCMTWPPSACRYCRNVVRRSASRVSSRNESAASLGTPGFWEASTQWRQ